MESGNQSGPTAGDSVRPNVFHGSNVREGEEHADADNVSIGMVGTFRSKMFARRFENTSRRRLILDASSDNLHTGSISRISVRSALTNDPGISERTSLLGQKHTIDEDEAQNTPVKSSPLMPMKSSESETSDWMNFREICIGKRISYLLLFAPFAVASHFLQWGPQWIFWLNFLTMIPLASILGDFTEEAALHTSDTIGGLLNASFGNAVEVVVGIQALLNNEIRVVQSSMIGSIFSNLLLVLGMCFFFGGLRYKEQRFSSLQATSGMGLLALSSIAMILPTPFAEYYETDDTAVLMTSRIAAIFLLISYILLLYFQLFSHKDSFETPDEEEGGDDEGEGEEAAVPLWMALLGLGLTTFTVTIFSAFLVESIDGFCVESGISRTFVGLIILPIVGNAVEHITAVSVAMKDKMDLALGVCIGSSTQIALFVVPVTVLVGWVADKDMTLNFPTYEVALYIISIFTVTVCLGTGKSNWLLGWVLMTTYIMLAIGFWFEVVENF